MNHYEARKRQSLLRRQIRNGRSACLDPQVGEEAIEDAVEHLTGEILDDADEYEELLQAVSTDPAARDAAREIVEYVLRLHTSITTSEETLTQCLMEAAREMARQRVMEDAA